MNNIFTNLMKFSRTLSVVLGIDYVDGDNVSVVTVPKYNNKVADPDLFDRDTRLLLPGTSLQPALSGQSVRSLSNWGAKHYL